MNQSHKINGFVSYFANSHQRLVYENEWTNAEYSSKLLLFEFDTLEAIYANSCPGLRHMNVLLLLMRNPHARMVFSDFCSSKYKLLVFIQTRVILQHGRVSV